MKIIHRTQPGSRTEGLPAMASRMLCKSRGAALALLAALAWVLPIAAMAQPKPMSPAAMATAMEQTRILQADKARWTDAQRKLGTDLLFAIRRAQGDPLFERLPKLRTGLHVPLAEHVDVTVRGELTPALRVAVSQTGVLLSSQPQAGKLRVRASLTGLMRLAEQPDVVSIRRNLGAMTNKINTSEGDVAHRTNQARASFGVDASGVRIGVLSDGVDSLASSQASGDLPANVHILPGQAGGGDEGTAMLEIVYDLAPGAELYFATGSSGSAQFAANITALANAGCDVIVDDIFYFDEPAFQDGIIAQAVADYAATGGLYFSSAGNAGNRNDGQSGVWEGDFSSDATYPAYHNFGSTVFDQIMQDAPFAIALQWSDPLAGSANDYDLYLHDAMGNVVAQSANVQAGTQDPLELIDSTDDHTNLYLSVQLYSGSPRFIWLNTMRGVLYWATAGQISGHAAVVGAFGVAAVDAGLAAGPGGTFNGTEAVETFSSDGPRRVFFNRHGVPLTPGNFSSTGGTLRDQPRITGADGVATSAPGFNPFYGTSAAAPHVAAIAALALELKPGLTPAQLDYAFSQTAMDIEASGFDRDSGHGLIDAMPLFGYIQSMGGNDMIFADGFD